MHGVWKLWLQCPRMHLASLRNQHSRVANLVEKSLKTAVKYCMLTTYDC